MPKKLINLQVQRIDGVGKPATGRRFLITKVQEPTVQTPREQSVRELANAGYDVLTALSQAPTIMHPKPEEIVSALNRLADLVDYPGRFAVPQPGGTPVTAPRPDEKSYGRPPRDDEDDDDSAQKLPRAVARSLEAIESALDGAEASVIAEALATDLSAAVQDILDGAK